MDLRARIYLMAICTAFMAPLRAGTALTFEVTTHSEPLPGAKPGQPTPKDRTFTQIVSLSGDVLQVETPQDVTRFDFKSSRMVRLDREKKEYEENSLYAIIGFEVIEFANRMNMGKMLAAGQIKANPFLPALTENIMSLSDPANAIIIDISAKGGDIAYSWNKRLLMSVSRKVHALPPEDVRQYVRFLRYEVGGHPKILAELERHSGVPERLTIVRTNVDAETRTLTLRGAEEQADAPLSLEGYTRAPQPQEPFTTLARLSASSADDLESHAKNLRQQRDAALSAGQVLDALLANMAAMLSTGDYAESTAWTAAHRDLISANADAQRLFASLKPHDEASAKQAAQTLQEMRPSAGPHAYMLGIFEANTRLGLHQNGEALSLFLSALHADPNITGAWIDLGTMYLNRYQTPAAWACWDAARAMRPGHPMLKKVDEHEGRLRSENPGFF